MAEIIVVGAGMTGSMAGLLLTRDGHSVTVLDRDPGPLPRSVDEAWESWNRRSIGQFRMPHLLLPRGTAILLDELPHVAARLELAGGLDLNLLDVVQASTPRAGRSESITDRRFDMLTGRRSTLEWVLAVSLEIEPLADVRRGAVVDGLLAGPEIASGSPHVTGVRLAGGEELTADLVVDATGRNSPTLRWLAELGGRPPVETSDDSGFAYYGRFYRSSDGSVPELRAPVLTPVGSISLLTVPSDDGTWSTMVYAASDDEPLRRLREPDVFDAVVRACPLHAHWIDGEPISDMSWMFGVADRERTFVTDGEPVVTGLAPIGDAVACSNPSLGRGMSFGFVHATILRDVVRKHLDDGVELARALGQQTDLELRPWWEATRQADRSRITEIRAIARGEAVQPDPLGQIVAALASAALVDQTAAEAWSEIAGCLTPADEVLARDGLLEHVTTVAAATPVPTLGPDRAELLDLIDGVPRVPKRFVSAP